ncbi:MAG: SNF2-related protein [Arenicellales bacterium]
MARKKQSTVPPGRGKASRKRRNKTGKRLSPSRRPDELDVEAWQAALRRQYGREQSYVLQNLGDEPVFSKFSVHNPEQGSRYRVAIRGVRLGDNFCSCPDFATNMLGTCKHIEFTLGRLEKKRGGAKALAQGFSPPYSEIYLRYGAERTVHFRPGTECPAKVRRSAARLFEAQQDWRLPTSRFERLEAFVARARETEHELRCYEDALTFIAEVRDAGHRRRVLDEAYPEGGASRGLENLLKTPLYPYQAEGALFAARAGRALIGDDMGLGKTVQAIAASELLARHFGAERVLVVCPVSVKHQWQREIARFAGRDAQVIVGPRAARQAQYREAGSCKITNYESVRRDLEAIQTWQPDVLIVDEAQRVKNWNTIAARALKQVDSPYAIVLTGTPLENRLEELMSIVQLVDRHRLGPTWRLQHDHQVRNDTGRVIGYRDLDRIGEALAPILIRRRKADVLRELPQRIDNTIFVPMTREQRAHHEENGDTVARIVQRWKRTGYLSNVDQRLLTCALQNMRMACNSTYLLDKTTDHGAKADELATLLEELFEDPAAKAVVFSQWVRTHELIIRRLDARGWDYVLFHGGVPGSKRGVLVDRFNEDPSCRVFLSTDAGGTGLNLQHAASVVINMDQPWNPAVLEQRIGRVHRLGQTRGVQVVNFVAEDTIEENMLSTLAFKQSLFTGVLDGGDKNIFLNGTRLEQFMERVSAASGMSGEPPTEAPQPAALDTPTAPPPVADPKAPGGRPEPPGSATAHQGDGEAVSAAWSGLISAGLALVETLSGARRSEADGQAARDAGPRVETDSQSGRTYLKVPLPEPEVVARLVEVLNELVNKSRA